MSRPGREPLHSRARYYRVRAAHRRWATLVGWAVWGVIGLAVAVATTGYIQLNQVLQAASPDTEQVNEARRRLAPTLPGEPVNVLLMGSDVRPGEEGAGDPGRSDSLILVRMDSRGGFVSLLSFPRDLVVQIPGYGEDKINAAYGIGGPKLTLDTVKAVTGEPINAFVIVDFKGFERLVDTLGGVYIDVDRTYFNDNAGCTPGAGDCYDAIDLKPGYQRLGGTDALDYVRYRHTDSDFARIARQQNFLSEVKRQLNSPGNLLKLLVRKDVIGGTITTSIRDPQVFLDLLRLAVSTPKDKIARVQVRGQDGLELGTIVTSQSQIDTAVAEWKDPRFEQDQSEPPPPPSTVDVTVLNGSGQLLAAERMADALRAKGYDAQPGGNADDFAYTASRVFYAPAFRASASAIRPLLGPSARTASLSAREANGNEVVAVAGADWAGELSTPPPPERRPPPDTVDTTSLVAPLRAVGREARMPVLVPLKVARGSEVRVVRAYRIDRAGGDDPAAVRVVFRLGGSGSPAYWGLSMTTMKDPPILDGETGRYDTGGRRYLTYYDGRNLQRLAWKVDGVTYWLSNTLDYKLSAKTMEEIAKQTRPPARAKLAKGRTDTPIGVETDASTP